MVQGLPEKRAIHTIWRNWAIQSSWTDKETSQRYRMGIVLKQSFQNTIITFIGFAFGAVNTLFLYTNILQPEYYGLVMFILATSAI